MRRLGLFVVLAACLGAFPLAASAQQRAYVLNGTAVFAGPGSDYPVVAQLGPGVRLNLYGCLNDYSWCDVTFGPNRGWVYAGEVGYPYQSSRVPVIEYGPRLALPIVTFSLGNYWDRYYRARPWYYERNDWARRYPSGYHGEYRRDWHENRNWNGNDNHRNGNNYNGNNYNGNNHNGNGNNPNWNNNPRAPDMHHQEQPRVNNEVRRNEGRVNGSVQNDGHGGYAPPLNPTPRAGPNGTVAPTTPTPATPGYYGGSG